MIVSIGIDIIEVYRIEEAIARTPRFVSRIFTPAERLYCEGRGARSAESYAARFAAKEAFFKALGEGWRGRLSWHDVEIVRDEKGAPTLEIRREAERLMKLGGGERVHLSISHTHQHAIAQVIIESGKES
ncbi:MAG: 4'-phosphopantetheinyl transferase [Blastocatellia bacterium]